MAVVIFVLAGWLLPGHITVIVHVVFVPLVVIQWWLNRGTCLITNLECWLLGVELPKDQQQGQFIKKLVALCYDPLPSDKKIKVGLYLVITASWAISIVRLLNE